MNQRQKKKRFKKVYGNNPPTGWIATERGYGIRKGRIIVSKRIAGELKMKIQTAFQKIAESLRKIWETYKKEMLKIANVVRNAWNNMEAISMRQQKEKGITVTAKALTRRREERKRSRGWRQCKF